MDPTDPDPIPQRCYLLLRMHEFCTCKPFETFNIRIPNNNEMCGRLRSQARKLHSLGLEVVLLLLDNRLQPGIERLICEARDKVPPPHPPTPTITEAASERW
jgi:hypothetical protein